jgi:hypothetical protein
MYVKGEVEVKYFEVKFADGYSIACKGERVPSLDEVKVFCVASAATFGEIVCVLEIDYDEVVNHFDTDNIENWPVFK